VSIEYARFQQSHVGASLLDAIADVDALAEQLRSALENQAAAIDAAHVHGASSSAVQVIASSILKDRLGFSEEVLLTHEHGIVSRPRPDFYYPLGPGRGIIAEVERGGTVTNNHDLKDIWKAHIAPDVQHLFLLVPNSNWKASGLPRERPFVRVTHRMGAFFGDPRREIDVLTCHVFGYGVRHLVSSEPSD
jgi:hypothetical protein